MARTVEEIYNSIISEVTTYENLKVLQPQINVGFQKFLDEITTTSKVAIWRTWVWIMTYAIWIHEQVFDQHKLDVIKRVENNQFGQIQWYVSVAKDFQNGYSLVWNEAKRIYEYPVIDSDAKIIEQASATDNNGSLIVKVAKSDGADGLEPLSADEQSSFEAYISRRQPAGIDLDVYNFTADLLRFDIDVFYDATKLNSSGELIADSIQTTLVVGEKPAEIAINNYIKAIPFDSDFRIIDFVDALQDADGVDNVVVNSCEAKYGDLSYTDILSETGQKWNTRAGYLEIDGDISTMLNYSL